MAQESRGLMGMMFKWMFILFNIFMAVIVYMSMGHTEESGTAWSWYGYRYAFSYVGSRTDGFRWIDLFY